MSLHIEPLSLASATSNSLFVGDEGGVLYLIKKYRGQGGSERRCLEKERLSRWRTAGFLVPAVFDKEIAGEAQPYLVMEYLEGETLGAYLKRPEVAVQAKLDGLARLFAQTLSRHRLVLEQGDAGFLHHDLNTGNILLCEGDFYHLDFEGCVPQPADVGSLPEVIGVELAKLVRWAARDMGREWLESVLAVMWECYKETRIPHAMMARVYSRPFQFVHRWRARKKISRHPVEVTKYDIADGIRRLRDGCGL